MVRPLWATGSQLSPALRQTLSGHAGSVMAIATAVLDGRPVAVSGSRDGSVRVWDLTSGEPVGVPLVGHQDWVGCVACAVVNGRPVAVSGSDDRAIRVWDLGTGEQIGLPMQGHAG
ncbi:hypothetical protein AB0J80_21590, partial [Actinoplanes sp. NPDC049548]